MIIRTDPGRKVFKISLLALSGLAFIVPFWLLVSASFRETRVLLQYPPALWPKDATLSNYSSLFSGEYPFSNWMINSIITASSTTIGALIVCSLAGYAFAKFRFFGKGFLFMLSMATLMIPVAVMLIPRFIMIKDLGLVNTLPGIFLPGIGSAFGVFLMRQFIATLPSSVLEAARVDGASHFRVYINIIVPLIAPALAVLAIYVFMGEWNDLIWPLIVAQSEDMKTIPVGIASMRMVHHPKWGLMMAASTLAFLPIFIVFLFSRRRFIEGMTAGAIKG